MVLLASGLLWVFDLWREVGAGGCGRGGEGGVGGGAGL